MGKKKQRSQQKSKAQKNRKNQQNFQGKRGKGRTKTSSNWAKYFATFQEYLKPKGIYMKDVDGDGNCLFRSIADQIDGDENNHRKYRDMAIKYMRDNKEFFKFFLDENEDFNKYLKDMEENGTWGGHFELVALSAALGVNFCLHMKDKDPYLVTAGSKYNKNIRMYHIAYHVDEHYSSVRKIGDEAKGPAEVIDFDFKFAPEYHNDDDKCSTESDEEDSKQFGRINGEGDGGEDEQSESNNVERVEYQELMSHMCQDTKPFYETLEDVWFKGNDSALMFDFLIKSLTIQDSKPSTSIEEKKNSSSNINDNNTNNNTTNTNANPPDTEPKNDNPPLITDKPVKTNKGWSKIKKSKIGPNDPCFCGSGRKLKKCCKVAP